MNIFAIISFLMALAVFYFSLVLASPNLGMFLDYPSMFIVLGGTFAAMAIGFKLNKIVTLFWVFFMKFVKGQDIKQNKIVEEMIQLIDQLKKGASMTDLKNSCKDLFLRESLELIEDGILNKEQIIDVLEVRRDTISATYMEDANQLKSMGKYPPAFGAIGTTIGMIVLLANLGGEDAMKMIGPAMGICLITTLYGSAVANVILIPMAENLSQNAKDIHKKNSVVIQGVKLILEKTSPILAAERLNSYLKPSERVDWKKIIQR